MNQIKILLVDDSKSARYALRLQLQRHGTQVETADSAESALERVREDPPDAVFMDHTMPGMNGLEALDILKAEQGTASIPVVICTSNEDPNYLELARRKGALDVLTKSAAKDRLPSLLVRIREIVAGAPVPAAEQGPAAEPATDTAALSGLIRRETTRLVDERLDRVLEERVQATLMPMLSGLGDRLTASVRAQTELELQQGLVEESKRLQNHFTGVQNEQTKLSINRLASELLPRAIAQQFEQERNNLAQLIQELIDNRLDNVTEEPEFMRRVLDMAEVNAAKVAEESARRYARMSADEIKEKQAGSVEAGSVNESTFNANNLYVVAGLAALSGIGASALVYLLLS